jgi:hypothetical protein
MNATKHPGGSLFTLIGAVTILLLLSLDDVDDNGATLIVTAFIFPWWEGHSRTIDTARSSHSGNLMSVVLVNKDNRGRVGDWVSSRASRDNRLGEGMSLAGNSDDRELVLESRRSAHNNRLLSVLEWRKVNIGAAGLGTMKDVDVRVSEITEVLDVAPVVTLAAAMWNGRLRWVRRLADDYCSLTILLTALRGMVCLHGRVLDVLLDGGLSHIRNISRLVVDHGRRAVIA